MAINPANCEVCIEDAWAEISDDGGNTWYVLPAVETITETVEENAAQQRRHSHNQKAFVDKCGSSSQSYVYDLVVQTCDNESAGVECYVTDQDVVQLRMHKAGGGVPATPDTSILITSAKYRRQPITWDNNTTDPELQTLRFEAQVSPVFENVTCDADTPKGPLPPP